MLMPPPQKIPPSTLQHKSADGTTPKDPTKHTATQIWNSICAESNVAANASNNSFAGCLKHPQNGSRACTAANRPLPVVMTHPKPWAGSLQIAHPKVSGAGCNGSQAHSPAANWPFERPALHLGWVSCRWRVHGVTGCRVRGIVHWARLLGVVHWCGGKLLRRVLSARWGCHGRATSCCGVGRVEGGLIRLCLWCCANWWCCCCVVMMDVLLCGCVFSHTNNDQGLQEKDKRQSGSKQ
jgi:hypothetical protein